MPPTELELIGMIIKIQENQSKMLDTVIKTLKEMTEIMKIFDEEI